MLQNKVKIYPNIEAKNAAQAGTESFPTSSYNLCLQRGFKCLQVTIVDYPLTQLRADVPRSHSIDWSDTEAACTEFRPF